MSLKNAEAVRKVGIEIIGYERIIDNYAIRHAMKEHGDVKTEKARGQIALIKEDFQRIPDIIENYDNVEYGGKSSLGLDVIRYSKKDNGIIYYVEEVRKGKKQVALLTMYKKKAGVASDAPSQSPAKSPSQTSGTLPPASTLIIPPSEKPVKVSEIEPKDTTLDFMGGQQIYEAAVRLVRKISPKAAGNVEVVKKKDDIGIIKALLASPDKMPSIIRYYVVHGKNAVVKQDRLRGIADREMKEIFKPLKSKEQVREFEALAWLGDMEGRNYTAQELDDMGVSATVRDAYLKHRKFHERAWRLLAAHRKAYGGGTGHREGHIPHFFENWNVYEMVEVTDDEGVTRRVPGGIAGTFRSLREATLTNIKGDGSIYLHFLPSSVTLLALSLLQLYILLQLVL